MGTYDGVIVRAEKSTCRWSGVESEKVGRERLLGGGAGGVGRGGAEPSTAASSGEQVTLRCDDIRSSGLDQGGTFEEHPGWEGNSCSPNPAGVEEYRRRAQNGWTLAT